MYSEEFGPFAEYTPKLVNQISGRYADTESAEMCDGTISEYFSGNTVVRQGCVLASINTLQHLPERAELSGSLVSILRIIFAETNEVHAEALDSSSVEAEPLG